MEVQGADQLPSHHIVSQRMKSTLGRGIPITTESREIVLKVYRYFTTEALTFKRSYCGYFNKVQQRVVDATGVSKATLTNLLNERDKLNSSNCEEKSGRNGNNIISTQEAPHSKRRKKKAHKMQSREIIYNVYGYMTIERDKFKQCEHGYFNDVQERVAKATGISRPTITKLIEAIDECGAFICNVSMKRNSVSPKTVNNKAIELRSESDNNFTMSDRDREASSEPEYILGLE